MEGGMSRRGFLGRVAAALGAWLLEPVRRALGRERERLRPEGEPECEVAVVGGGFAGVAAAALLAGEDYDVVLLEKEAVAGGRARAGVRDGWQYARGVSYIGRPEGTLRRLFQLAKLEPVRVPPPVGALFAGGQLLRGRAAVEYLLGGEPGARRRRLERLDERLGQLARAVERDPWQPGRRALRHDRTSLAELLGRLEAPAPLVRYLDGQMRGIFGASLAELSALYAAPEAYFELPEADEPPGDPGAAERPEHPDDALYTLPETLGELPRRLGARLGERARLGAEVRELRWDAEARRFGVHWVESGGEQRRLRARAVVLAVPAPVALALARELLVPEVAGALARVRYAPYVTVNLFSPRPLMTAAWDLSCLDTAFTDLYDATRVQARARGVPEAERPGILGVYVPGAHAADRSWVEMEEGRLLARLFADLERVLGRQVRHEVEGWDVARFGLAFPVFYPGYHAEVLGPLAAPAARAGAPLYLAGDYACYPTVEGAVASAERAAEALDEAW
ncbi:MAG: hypothetical protein KatS3mg102_2365 [Planctomycetota bacterium]|nr:MAG: hypothetical protein KatS3mg102_2365 [Planctomycetota bacterium]